MAHRSTEEIRTMMYIAGTIADVIDNGDTATLVLDAGHHRHQLQADSRLLADGLTALFGTDWIGKAIAVQCEGATLTSIEIPGAPPNYAI
ncbi:hypothetical protein BN873_610126 [Candidatus Competibacter denitrificans Run_A_D11]|uniref:Uncharacterized protein n=1 Tax=Candidatus Competibacter denitrificans Run_A_D11 TaxID=1400863 RepID=W6MAF7_9GAMM|nr:hypothetical protein [Candidatus Competibacter denitrificans]CDI03729.1 hypothetical protein BN873_610126 [Candidatus Competibacter denitrificans Run_A_D11]HAS86584.1 hypothetical protein [Candidatus Competibacteraceae bacterium]HRC68404.1 hypothetical protein [Candidatus Competibacter denitrificans]